MTVREFISEMKIWLSTWWDLLWQPNFSDMTIGQFIFSIFSVGTTLLLCFNYFSDNFEKIKRGNLDSVDSLIKYAFFIFSAVAIFAIIVGIIFGFTALITTVLK